MRDAIRQTLFRQNLEVGVFLVYLQMRPFGHILGLLDPHQARLVTSDLKLLLHYFESSAIPPSLPHIIISRKTQMMRARRCARISRVQIVVGEVIGDDVHLHRLGMMGVEARSGLRGIDGLENPDGAGETDDAAS